ncbi:MAG TPA: pyridoxal-dependent decarboxylase [Blastocatellia bacterium]|nr:pyridoxal-dependent decarboxylase [Blastocatellia bacterium]
MSAEEFRRNAHVVVDWIADYLAHPQRFPVLSRVQPGDIKRALPSSAPELGEPFEAMLADLNDIIVPGVTHWNHPAFFGYFAISGSAPGILGEMLSAAFNVNAMLWRTSPSATELEEVTLSWLRQMIGLPSQFEGVVYDTASIATMCAVAAAREVIDGLDVRHKGLCRASEPLRFYCSEHAHSSVDKAAITLGLGLDSLRKIPCDDEFRIDSRALASAIAEDRANGWRPFCVVATVGTTSVTSVDPVPAIADICSRESLWLHVDAAYGGAAAACPEMRWVLEGCEAADSIVFNPHKWMFVPFDFSAMYCRRLEVLRRAFSLVPEYLRTADSEEVKNFMDYGPQLGRRFRALKMWFVLRYFGREGLAARIREHIRLSAELKSWIETSSDWEMMAPAPFSLVCFRARPSSADYSEEELEKLNTRLLEAVNRRGKVFLSHTKLNGRYTLRLAIGNIRTTAEHVRLAWDELSEVLSAEC